MYVPLTKMFPQDKKKKKGGEILQENINGQGFSMKTASELRRKSVFIRSVWVMKSEHMRSSSPMGMRLLRSSMRRKTVLFLLKAH